MTSKTENNIIRNMSEHDLSEIMKLENKIFPDPWSEKLFKEQITDTGWGGIVAENDSGIIGYACYYIAAGEGHLTNIAVKEEFRRKSVAKLLLDNILRIALENECEFVLLEVRPSNSGAILFYEKYDFKFLYKRPEYYHNPVEDAIVMVYYFDKTEDER